MHKIIHLVFTALAVMTAAYLLPGVEVSSFFAALVVAVVLGILNIAIKPILVILTLPINILTLGLFTLVINAVLVLLTDKLVSGFEVGGFWRAFVFSVLLMLIGYVLHSFEHDGRRRERQ